MAQKEDRNRRNRKKASEETRYCMEKYLASSCEKTDLNECNIRKFSYALRHKRREDGAVDMPLESYVSKMVLAETMRELIESEILKDDDPKTRVRLAHVTEAVEATFDIRFGRKWIGLYSRDPVYCQCGNEAVFIDFKYVYHGRSYGNIWYCPCCHRYVGVHYGTNIPKGELADQETRTARMAFHSAFAKKQKQLENEGYHDARSLIYRELAGMMNIPAEKCHGGMFSAAECRRAIRLLLNVMADDIAIAA